MAKRRRIPSWVVLLAFAVFVGGAIGLLAYARARRVRDTTRYCLARTPSSAVVRERASIPLVEHGSKRGAAFCELHFRPRADAPSALVVISRKGTHWNTRVMEVAGPTQRQPGFFEKPGVRGAYVDLLDGDQVSRYVLIFPGRDGDEALELQVDPKVFELEEAVEIAADIAARLR